LADENVPREVVEALRDQHDVLWAYTDASGSSDREILALAAKEQRLVVTLDKDFGELAFRSGLAASSGIVLLRIRASSASILTRIAIAALDSRSDWANHFSVIENDRIRMTRLP
jgi:predicted nuclease of predicted toxin-antitoxin system